MANSVFDHVVYAAAGLLAGVEEFTAATGVRPVAGGRHLGYGTANYLVGLGAGRYLEVVGVDPDATDSLPRRMFGIEPGDRPRLLTWAVRTDDIDAAVAEARRGGYDPGDPAAMSRRTATGELLEWQLTPDTLVTSAGLAPFLIDWGGTRHPTLNELPLVELVSLTLSTPEPARLARALAALGVTALAGQVQEADHSGMLAVLATPRGFVTLN